MARFKRILLKLSGESLMGNQNYGIDPERLGDYARQIKEIHEMGVQIGIVIGGGNIFRGLSGSQKGFDRVKGDQMGMCATVINSLALSSALEAEGVKLVTLGDYEHTIEIAAKTGYVSQDDIAVLKEWRKDPANWKK